MFKGSVTMEKKEYKYDAFISYRHCDLDKFVAENLHKALKDNKIDSIAAYLEKLISIFSDDLYLELQPGRFSEQLRYNDFLVCLAKRYKLKLVASNDVHYLRKEDSEAHNYHVLDVRKDETGSFRFIYQGLCY